MDWRLQVPPEHTWRSFSCRWVKSPASMQSRVGILALCSFSGMPNLCQARKCWSWLFPGGMSHGNAHRGLVRWLLGSDGFVGFCWQEPQIMGFEKFPELLWAPRHL